MSEPPSHRTNNFDFIRIFAASAVVLSHSYELSGHGVREPLVLLTHGQYSLGRLAVDCFFILSGYLVTQSWLQSKGAGEYFLKRALRIYPGFIAVSLFCVLLVGPLAAEHAGSYWSDLSWWRFLRRAALLLVPATPPVFANLPNAYHLNGSLWSISIEAICYFSLPVLAWLGCLKNRHLLPVVTALFFAAYVLDGHFHFLPDIPLVSPIVLVQQFTYFFAGATIYLFRDSLRWSAGYAVAVLAVLVGSLALGHFHWATPFCLPYLLIWFATNSRIRLHAAAKYGDFSYGVYLYAYPLQQLIVLWSGLRVTPLGLFLFALPASFLCAFLSWHLVEAPAMRLKRRFMTKAAT